jgi:hypothetical protein
LYTANPVQQRVIARQLYLSADTGLSFQLLHHNGLYRQLGDVDSQWLVDFARESLLANRPVDPSWLQTYNRDSDGN